MSIVYDIKAHKGDIDDIDFHPNSKMVTKISIKAPVFNIYH